MTDPYLLHLEAAAYALSQAGIVRRDEEIEKARAIVEAVIDQLLGPESE